MNGTQRLLSKMRKSNDNKNLQDSVTLEMLIGVDG